MKLWNKAFLVLGLTIVIFLANYLLRKKLPDGYSDTLSYNQLYFTIGQLRIDDYKWFGNDSLIITFAGSGIKEKNLFRVYCDGQKLLEQEAPALSMKPYSGLKKYFIKVNSLPDSIEVDIEFTPSAVFRSFGSSGADAMAIIIPSLPWGTKHLKSIQEWRWKNDSWESLVKEDEVQRYVIDSIKIRPSDNTETRVIKISQYICSVTNGAFGIPSDLLNKLSPVEQLSAIRTGKSKLWCGNYALLFAFFANRCDVPVRLVGSGTLRNRITNGTHAFNEVFLKEYNRWAFVDLTYGNIFVKNKSKFLNTIDIYRLLRYDLSDSNLIIMHTNGELVTNIPFTKSNFQERDYFNYNNEFSFFRGNYNQITLNTTLIDHFKNFLYSKPYYFKFSDSSAFINYHFYARLLSNYLMVLIFVAWAFFLGIFIIKKILKRSS